jgi:hypothetical protein
MSVTFEAKTLVIDGLTIPMQWPVLDAVEHGNKVFVLLDPDAYLLDADYKRIRRQGSPAIKNLLAFDRAGDKLWDAELPESADYYYKISSTSPLVANSFSSYRCQIDSSTGAILAREFLK